MVYIDELRDHETDQIKSVARRFGKQWCHLLSESQEDLHRFAALLSLRPQWFQNDHPNPAFWHYDLVPSKRKMALRLGAQEITTREWIERLLDRTKGGKGAPSTGL